MYTVLFNDFIDDDHDHNVSVVALTVQMFTVPTIARMLMTEESAMKRILDSLLDHCKQYESGQWLRFFHTKCRFHFHICTCNFLESLPDFLNAPYAEIFRRPISFCDFIRNHFFLLSNIILNDTLLYFSS